MSFIFTSRIFTNKIRDSIAFQSVVLRKTKFKMAELTLAVNIESHISLDSLEVWG